MVLEEVGLLGVGVGVSGSRRGDSTARSRSSCKGRMSDDVDAGKRFSLHDFLLEPVEAIIGSGSWQISTSQAPSNQAVSWRPEESLVG